MGGALDEGVGGGVGPEGGEEEDWVGWDGLFGGIEVVGLFEGFGRDGRGAERVVLKREVAK